LLHFFEGFGEQRLWWFDESSDVSRLH